METNARERRIDLAVAAIVLALALALSLSSHLVNTARAGDRIYLGFSMNPPDQAVYLSWIEQARRGGLALGNLFDARPAPAKLPNLTFLAIGRLAAWTGTDTRTAYVASRAFAILAMVLAALALAGALARDALARRLALAWMLLGTGWGIYFILVNGRGGGPDVLESLIAMPWCPADVAIPEFTPATACANFSHMMVGMALMAFSLASLVHARKNGSTGRALLGGVAALLAGYAHVYDVIVLLAVVSLLFLRAWARGDRPAARTAAAYLGPAAVPFVHYVYIFLTDPYLREWSRVPLPSPSPTAFALGLGTAFVLALLALRRMLSAPVTRDDELVAVWILAQSALLYSGPAIYFERRLCEGLWFPFVMLGAAEFSSRVAGRSAGAHAAALVVLAATVLPTGLAVNALASHRQPDHRWYFRPLAELEAITGLSQVTSPADVILAEPSVALLIPGLAGRTVAVGHVDHTRNYTRLARAAIRFHTGQMPRQEALDFLARTGATYYLASSMDQLPVPLGPDVLVPVSRHRNLGLYRVRADPGAP